MVVGGPRPGPVKPHKAALWRMVVETGFVVDQVINQTTALNIPTIWKYKMQIEFSGCLLTCRKVYQQVSAV